MQKRSILLVPAVKGMLGAVDRRFHSGGIRAIKPGKLLFLQ